MALQRLYLCVLVYIYGFIITKVRLPIHVDIQLIHTYLNYVFISTDLISHVIVPIIVPITVLQIVVMIFGFPVLIYQLCSRSDKCNLRKGLIQPIYNSIAVP